MISAASFVTDGTDAVTVPQRFWAKIRIDGDCWIWTAFKDHYGYGRFKVGGHHGKPVSAHRYAYEKLVGAIPEGLVIDHLCRNRACVNPAHMEPVSNEENKQRGYPYRQIGAAYHKTRPCPKNHDLSELAVKPGSRRCKACERERKAKKS
jgi:hypothetical protein